MTDFQQELVYATQDEIDTALAHVLSDLMDISNATDETYTIMVTPDNDPILIIDGKVSKDFSYGEKKEAEVPVGLFGGVTEALNRLSIFKNKED